MVKRSSGPVDKRSIAIPLFFSLLCLCLQTASGGLRSSRSEFGLGADYASQAFRTDSYDTLNQEWLEEDTLDMETEVRGSWDFSLEAGGTGRGFELENSLDLSTGSMRDRLDLEFEQELVPALKLCAGNRFDARHYHGLLPGLADTEYLKDYLNNRAELELRLKPANRTELRVSEQTEVRRFSEPDSFDYDYLLNLVRLEARQDIGLGTGLDAEYSWQRRWADQDAGRSFHEHGLWARFDRFAVSGMRLSLQNELRRRVYQAAEYSYWEEAAGVALGRDLSWSFSLELEDDARWTWYDSATDVYADVFENSVRLSGKYNLSTGFSVELGPRFDFGVGLEGPGDEDFREISVRAGLDLFRADRLWLSLEDRPGRRVYLYADSSYQSAYWFNELDLLLNWTLVSTRDGILELGGMASIVPEWHVDVSDNTSIGFFSLEMRYRVR